MRKSVTLVMFVKEWLETIKRNEIRPSSYDRLLTSYATMTSHKIASMYIDEITAKDFRMYTDELLESGYAITTIKKQMRLVSAAMRYAYEQRYIDFNPCVGINPPSEGNVKKKPKHIEAYTKEEQLKLLKVLRSRDRKGYNALELMLETGIRVGEVLALNWDDVALSQRRMKIHSTLVNLPNKRIAYVQEGAKSKTSNRVVPLNANAVKILSSLKRYEDQSAVFLGEDNERLSYESLRYQCQRACEDASVRYSGLHVFRHTFATNQYYKGTDVKILSKILGHSDTSITYNIYIHLYGDGFDDMLRAVD